jgi:hypothetical protein
LSDLRGRIGLVGELLATPIVFQFEAFCYFHFDAERGSSLASGRRSCRMRAPRFAAHVVVIVAIAVLVTPAVAEEWPSGTVRVVVPYAAGGPVDVPARLLIERLAAQTKGVFILETGPARAARSGCRRSCRRRPTAAPCC